MAKHRRTAYQKATEALEEEGRKQCMLLYSATAIALNQHWNKGKQTILSLFEVSADAFHGCAETNKYSMIEICEKETGITVLNETGKSWEDLPYLNGTLRSKPMTTAQWTYMRMQQIKWIPSQVMACIMIALHRKYGFGFDRLSRFYGQVDEVRAEYGGDADRIREECRQLTGIDVADTTTKKEAKVV